MGSSWVWMLRFSDLRVLMKLLIELIAFCSSVGVGDCLGKRIRKNKGFNLPF
ncbi:MAG: hypothetical protein ACTSRP_07755 [Candidatus Helarchaeota archaeon]